MTTGINDEPGISDEVESQLFTVRVNWLMSQFNLTTIHPNWPDDLRWQTTLNNGTVSNSQLSASSSGDNPKVTTRERSNYAPGHEAVFGAGTQVIDPPTGDQDMWWGGDDGTDAVGFGRDATGPYIYYHNDGGGRTKVYKSDWNGDSIRGFNDFEDLRISRVDHLWYKGGAVAWRILDYYDAPDSYGLKTVHTEDPGDGAIFSNPNLPVHAEVDAGTTSSSATLELNAVHYEKGADETDGRVNGEHFNVSGIDSTDWYHVISFRKRSGWDMINAEPLGIFPHATGADVKLELQLGASLSSTSWSRPTHSSDSETAIEVSTAGTIDTDGERRKVGTAPDAKQGGGGTPEKFNFNVPSDQVVTIAAQAFGSQSNGTLLGHIEWEEVF